MLTLLAVLKPIIIMVVPIRSWGSKAPDFLLQGNRTSEGSMNENCDGFSDRKFYTEIVHFFNVSKINSFSTF